MKSESRDVFSFAPVATAAQLSSDLDRTGSTNSTGEFPVDAMESLGQKISERTAGRIRDLRCESVGHMVVLSGRTSTYYVKQLATQIVLGETSELEGCPVTLQNEIDVV